MRFVLIGLSNELTTAVEIPLSPISSEEEAPARNRTANISSHGHGSILSNGNSKPKKIINKHPGHRRSFSSDLIERYKHFQFNPLQPGVAFLYILETENSQVF